MVVHHARFAISVDLQSKHCTTGQFKGQVIRQRRRREWCAQDRTFHIVMACRADDLGEHPVQRPSERRTLRRFDQAGAAGAVDELQSRAVAALCTVTALDIQVAQARDSAQELMALLREHHAVDGLPMLAQLAVSVAENRLLRNLCVLGPAGLEGGVRHGY